MRNFNNKTTQCQIHYEKIKRLREWQKEKGTLPCLIVEGVGVGLYVESGSFSSNF